MSEFDAQRVAERIDIVLDILVAGAITTLRSIISRYLKQNSCARLLNLRQTSRRHRGRSNNRAFRFSYLRMPGASVFFYLVL